MHVLTKDRHYEYVILNSNLQGMDIVLALDWLITVIIDFTQITEGIYPEQ